MPAGRRAALAAALVLAVAASAALPGAVAGEEPGAPRDGVPGLREERRSAFDEAKRARQAEARAREELLAARLRLARAEAEVERLRRGEEAARAELAAARARLDDLRREAAAERRRVGAWLRFLHEEGSPRLLDVLLGAEDLADFAARLQLVSGVVERGNRRLRRLRELHEEARRGEAALAGRRQALAALLAAEREAVGELRRRETEREEALARATAALGERAAALEALDRRWAETAPALDAFLRGFPDLPWDRVRPAAVRLTLRGGLVLEVEEDELNGSLLEGAPVDGRLRVRLEPGRVHVVPAEGEPAGGFRLTATLEARDGRLALVPVSLEVLGVPVGEAVLREVARAGDLALDPSRLGAVFPVTGVEVEAGRLRIRLGP